ncbi:MAG: DUF4252 domain-containing protein [Winogradskyella sp.]|uniref:DUF4252 domain-containing protein n=1 Tax=Winogradskyella sp. TaxID=1883156 RepID=UPI0038594B75
MIQSIKKSAVLLLLIAMVTSCNQEPTLQTYYVDNELKPGFSSFDLPTSFIDVKKVEMTQKQEDAYESVDKLNILTFMKADTEVDIYTTELEKVKTILDNPKYEELMRGGNSTDGKFVIKFLGDVENIDELIIFGHSNNKGFMIARVLGDDMSANKMMSLASVLKDADYDQDQLKDLKAFFN